MAINKVVYGNDTLVDLTEDSVSANNLLEGETAHDRSGNPVTGTAKQGHIVQNSSGTDMTQRSTIQFKGVIVTDDATNGKTVVQATKTSVGLGNVPNVTTDNQTPTVTEASTRANLAAGDTLKTIIGKIKKFFTDIKDLAFIAKDGSTSKYLRGDGTWQVPPDTKKVFFGTCTGQAANQKKAVTISSDQNFTLTTGAIIFVKFDANNTYSATADAPVQLNVNSSGDKTVYGAGSSALTGTNTTFFGRINYVNQYIYDGTYWIWTGSSADNNTTYTPQALGIGYGTCTTAAATTAKVATLSGYSLVTNGIVSVKFTNSVPANATLNINNKGAKKIYYQGAKIVAGVIKAGDIATFVYSGNYNLICIDRGSNGHIIVDSSGSQLASENSLQFADSHVSDNPTNGRTVVENIKEHTTKADYDNATEDGFHVIDDGEDAVIHPSSDDYVEVEQVIGGTKTYGELLRELRTKIDASKLTDNAVLKEINGNDRNIYNYCYQYGTSSAIQFSRASYNNGGATTVVMDFISGSYYVCVGTNRENRSINTAPEGYKITLYYGNKKATVDLQTTANRCWYDSENTVKQKLDLKLQGFRDTVTIPAISAGQNGSITVPFTRGLPYSVSFIANQSGKCFVASNYWTDGTNLNVSVYSVQGTSGETALINVIY